MPIMTYVHSEKEMGTSGCTEKEFPLIFQFFFYLTLWETKFRDSSGQYLNLIYILTGWQLFSILTKMSLKNAYLI